jgi:hypothetical protein
VPILLGFESGGVAFAQPTGYKLKSLTGFPKGISSICHSTENSEDEFGRLHSGLVGIAFDCLPR